MADKNPPTFEEMYSDQIQEKTALGLSVTQAIEVIRAQIAWDAQLEKEAAAAAKAAKPAK